MEIVEININDLVPFDKNPRINEASIEKVATSIDMHGFNQPIVIDQNNRICVGHSRFYAAKRLDMDSVPVYKKEMTEAQFLAYNIADNKTSEFSTWDEDLLKDNLIELGGLDEQLLESTGFDEESLTEIFDSMESVGEDSEEDSPNKEIKPDDLGKAKSKMVHTCPECGHKFSGE